MDVAADSFFVVSAFDKGLEDSCDLVSGSINEGEDLGRFSSLGLASATDRSITGSSLDLNFEKSIDFKALNKDLRKLLVWALSSNMRYFAPCPRASITVNQENEKVKEIEARKKITINIREPTTPKIFERLVNINAPINPPDDDCGK